MLPICTLTVLMDQVLTLGVDMMNLLMSFVCCTSSQGRFQRSQGTVSATGKMSLINAVDISMLKTPTKAASRARTGCASNE